MTLRLMALLSLAMAVYDSGCAPKSAAPDQQQFEGLPASDTSAIDTALSGQNRDNGLVVSTTDIQTDGRNLKIRGRIVNPNGEAVEGIRYRVLLLSRDTKRVLDTFFERRDNVKLEAGESTALRIDIASMYAATAPLFFVEAYPMRLGGRELPEPADW